MIPIHRSFRLASRFVASIVQATAVVTVTLGLGAGVSYWLEPTPPAAPPTVDQSRSPPVSLPQVQELDSTTTATASPRQGMPPAATPESLPPPPAPAILDPAPFSDDPPAETATRSLQAIVPVQTLPPLPGRKGLTVLHFGDSHVASDLLTGAIRKRLQAKFGDGGPGYLVAGVPSAGARSESFEISASPGWRYTALQGSQDVGQFALSGFNSTAAHEGEVLTFSAGKPIEFDTVELEVTLRPNGGSLDVRVDDALFCHCQLTADQDMRAVLRLTRRPEAKGLMRKLTLTTTDDGPVSIASLSVTRDDGLVYSQVGYPGATVNLLNKIEPMLLADELQRLRPHVVVLSFGTTEGGRDDLDIAAYKTRYVTVIRKIRAALPDVQLVMMLPPDGERLPEGCKGQSATADCKQGLAPLASTITGDPACVWMTLPHLIDVRDTQLTIAREESVPSWNWSDLMPQTCGAHQWTKASPRLMSADHVTLTPEGYRRSAEQFADFLTPLLLSRLAARATAASD